jgi:hypothetical protein
MGFTYSDRIVRLDEKYRFSRHPQHFIQGQIRTRKMVKRFFAEYIVKRRISEAQAFTIFNRIFADVTALFGGFQKRFADVRR